jgi:hypothetical protein
MALTLQNLKLGGKFKKYLFTGSLKKKSIDNLETQKKYISMENFQFFIYLLYAKSK